MNKIEKMLRYLGNLAVNGHPEELGANPEMLLKNPAPVPSPVGPSATEGRPAPERKGWRDLLLAEGPEALSKAVREKEGVLLTGESSPYCCERCAEALTFSRTLSCISSSNEMSYYGKPSLIAAFLVWPALTVLLSRYGYGQPSLPKFGLAAVRALC